MNVVTAGPLVVVVDRLHRRLVEIDQQLLELKHELNDAIWSQVDEGTITKHPADEASDMLVAETDISRIRELRAEVRDIGDALKRIEASTYGHCFDCGKAIDPERLAVLPLAERCLTCQVRRDEHGAH